VASFHPQTQFFTTRGYAVLQVNHRGSTGYGTAYAQALRGQWGVYDVEDAVSGATYLAEHGWVEPQKLVIMGGSAGGYTVLQALVRHPGFFKAAVCLYGISNLFTLAATTHKFEAHYLDSLVGPLPEAADLYRERSPLFAADRIRDPIALFQGGIDQVVPKAQADAIVASLTSRGVPHVYHVYAGEGHGWRKAETIAHFYATVEAFLRQYVLFA
jgi:dipeptidyl aminopeptidase/acylaminoacyl peptidase